MGRRVRGWLARARTQVRRDLVRDPYLAYILLLATVLAGFWFWHLVPNFATRDEHDRLFDVLVALGTVLEDPSVGSLREGITYGRVPFGATFYLFGLAVLPVAVVAALTGQLGLFTAFHYPDPAFGAWEVWHATPEWIWTWSLAFVRLFNVAFAVGSVYLTYRIGVALRDRTAGRLSALLLTLTWGFLSIAHEGGEDMPALFFVLLALYLALRYVQTGDGDTFLTGSAAGGIAIAFKLTAAPVVAVIGAAYLLRAHTAADWRSALLRPGVLIGGAVVGAATIVLGFPSALVAGLDPLQERFVGGSTSRMSHPYGPDAPTWWWFLRAYLNGLGWPLFLGVLVGAVASLTHYRDRATSTAGVALVALPVVAYVLLFAGWHDLRVHHLLPTFPLLVALLAVGLARLHDRSPALARPAIALLVVTSGAYALVGDAGYATQPRDRAVEWLETNAPENATMEVYRRDMQDAAIPHDMDVRYAFDEGADGESGRCPEYVQLGYRDLLYLKEGTYYRNGERQASYLRALLEGEYNYEIAAEFGQRPPNFVPRRATPGSLGDLVAYGIVPRVDQYADEQEVGPNQYTVLLEHTGECDPGRDPPF